MKIIFETTRLLLREVDESDLEGFYEMDSDPEVARYVDTPPVKDKAQCLEIIHSIQQQYNWYGMGRWSVVLKSSGAFLGWCGLKRMAGITVNGKTGFVDIGYRFAQRHWGQGYASESAQATMDYGFTALKCSEICAFADTRNKASHKVLTKIGLERGNEFDWQGISCIWFQKTQSP